MNNTIATEQLQIGDWSGKLGREIGGLRGFVTTNRWRIVPFQPILKAMGADSPAKVFDIGGGEGLLLFLAEQAGLISDGLCVDANARNISSGEIALKKAGAQHVQVQHTDTTDAWPDDVFDIVTMVDVVHHVPTAFQQSFIEDACKRVRPGGLFIYKDMANTPFWMAAANRLHDLLLAQQWIEYAPISDVENWVTNAGFTLEQSDVIDILWYRHELRVFRKEA